ncbi:MAG: hypothetical protein AAGJ38_09280 [Planctomycetota bacterium]
MPQPTQASRSEGSVFKDTPAESATPSTSRSLVVMAHAVLLVLAVGVVWATMGRDTGSVVEAAAPSALPEASESIAVNAPRVQPPNTPAAAHVVAAPLPVEQTRPEFTQPAVTPAPTLPQKAAKPAEPFRPMVAIPEPGAVFPPVMPADPSDDPYYTIGGLYGTPGAARLVYVIDASGSLIDTFPFILAELQRAISELQPEQSFAVLFFSGDHVTEAPPYGMKRATTQAVRHTNQWIDPGSGRIMASGRPHADAAIRRALAYQPDAIILLSDGITGRGDQALTTRARLLSLIGTANIHDVVFHTLQVRRPDPLASPTRQGTLELIAMQSGGVHRYLGEDDLLPD